MEKQFFFAAAAAAGPIAFTGVENHLNKALGNNGTTNNTPRRTQLATTCL